jgi:hypothetical protein
MLLMAKKTKLKGRARERGDSEVFTTEFDAELYAALEAFVDRHKPKTTRRAVLEWAVEEFLTKREAWPAK